MAHLTTSAPAPPPVPLGFGRNLPVFRPVARKLMALIGNDTCTLKAVASLIQSDAAFTVEVLRFANSAILQMRYEVVNVPHAVSVIGMDRLRGMVLMLAMRDALACHKSDATMRSLWRHNLACALAAEALADVWWIDKSTAYTAGLIHDIGRLALFVQSPKLYPELLAHSLREQRPLAELELEYLGLDSTAAGLWVWEHWGLPQSLHGSVCCHQTSHPQDSRSLESLIALACSVADIAGFAVQGSATLPPIPSVEAIVASLPYKVNLFETEFLK